MLFYIIYTYTQDAKNKAMVIGESLVAKITDI
jgi:hypothetical protein